MSASLTPFRPGETVRFYPRVNKPGHDVEIVECRPHPFYCWIVRFRYRDGRIQERTILKFFTSPD